MAVQQLVRPVPLGSCSYQGITFGPGQKIQVVSHSGLDDTPDLRTNDEDRAQADGQWSGEDFLGARIPTITFVILGDDNTDLQTQLASFVRAFKPKGPFAPLWLYNSTRFLTAKVRKRGIPQQEQGGWGKTAWCSVQFYARDPYYYGPQQSLTVGAPTIVPGSGGIAFPITFPLTFGTSSTVVSGGNQATNIGDDPTPVRIYIPGPCLNPVLSNDQAGKALRFAIQLNAGDFLVADSDLKTVILNGSAYRNDVIDGRSWWDLPTGLSQIRYSSDSAAAGESATVSWNPRWQ